MAIDQTREQGVSNQIDDLRIGRYRTFGNPPLEDRGDQAVLDNDDRVGQCRGAAAVDQSSGPDHEDLRPVGQPAAVVESHLLAPQGGGVEVLEAAA
ncbi:MAG TPA: hypothetical protein VGL39_21630 [Jatrophihabitantaceae bacterium]